MDLDSSTELLDFEAAPDLSGSARVSLSAQFVPTQVTHITQPQPPITSPEEELSAEATTLLESATPPIGRPDIPFIAEPSTWNQYEYEANLMETYFTQLPALDYGSWLHGFDDAVSSMFPSSGMSEGMPNAIAMMREHFQPKSGAVNSFTSDSHHMWYSDPPCLQMYDKDMVNVLLNIAKRQLDGTFALLIPFLTSADVEEELIMAISAVGALYCDVVGSDKIAKACYNDARRILLAKFIMLEVYGLCSGDARSYEFVEALHGYVLQMLGRCIFLSSEKSNSAAEEDELKNVVEAIHLLECYRVLLLQRPPTLTPLTTQFRSSCDENELVPTRYFHNLADLLPSPRNAKPVVGTLIDLAMIVRLTWFGGPRASRGQESRLWKLDFVELALTRWGEATAHVEEPLLLVLYHMAHLNLHSDLGLLQRHARKAAKGCSIPPSSSGTPSIKGWLASQQYDISAWHAERLLKTSKSAFRSHNRATHASGSGQQQQKAQNLNSEPPHLPFCIYFASLVLWYGCLRPDQDSSRGNLCIVNGMTLLSRLNVQVARNLSNALQELTLAEQWPRSHGV
ncbi:hypothetical protein H2200_005898 [Cladophialophora chaetospira]|uniref:Transcription factor domain-containing protein n=1 Tax=Cladophialophora chaetospira TaxID=386627 RepID=A0AA39CIJ5_9EURO|nr:hypothetical protein H2200_005898 [Cladophialophora chaetospira]